VGLAFFPQHFSFFPWGPPPLFEVISIVLPPPHLPLFFIYEFPSYSMFFQIFFFFEGSVVIFNGHLSPFPVSLHGFRTQNVFRTHLFFDFSDFPSCIPPNTVIFNPTPPCPPSRFNSDPASNGLTFGFSTFL